MMGIVELGSAEPTGEAMSEQGKRGNSADDWTAGFGEQCGIFANVGPGCYKRLDARDQSPLAMPFSQFPPPIGPLSSTHSGAH